MISLKSIVEKMLGGESLGWTVSPISPFIFTSPPPAVKPTIPHTIFTYGAALISDVEAVGNSLGPELLTDGGFENWTSPSQLTNWTTRVAIGSPTLTRITSPVHSGTYAAQITGNGDNPDILALESNLMSGTPGDIIVFSGWQADDGGNASTGTAFFLNHGFDTATEIYNFDTEIWDTITGGGGVWGYIFSVMDPSVYFPQVAPSATYTENTATLPVPSSGEFCIMAIGVPYGGGASFTQYIDDYSIKIQTASTPVTLYDFRNASDSSNLTLDDTILNFGVSSFSALKMNGIGAFTTDFAKFNFSSNQLSVANAVDNEDAVNLGQLTSIIASTDINSLTGYPLSIAHGGTNNTSYTSGSVLYFDGSKIAEDNSNFFYNATNKQLAIGANTFDATYQKLNVVGFENTGQGVVSTLRNTDTSSYSFASYEMYAGTSGNYGGKFFGSRSAYYNFGIVNGLTFRAGRSDQDIGFAVGSAISGTALSPALVIKSTGQVVINNYQASSFLSGTYQFEIYSSTGSANFFVNSTGAYNSNLRMRGQNSSTVYMDVFSGKDGGVDAYGFYGYGSAYAVFGTNGTGRLYIASDGNVGIGGHPGGLALSLVKTQNATSVFQMTNTSNGSSASMQMKMVNDSYNGSGMYMTSSTNNIGGGVNSLNIFNDAGPVSLYSTGNFTINPSSGNSTVVNSDLKINTVGKGLYIKEGTNATSGTATLSGGTVVVSTTKVTANSRIQLTINGGTLTNVGAVYVSARTAGTSFTISSVNVLDASDVSWVIIEPA